MMLSSLQNPSVKEAVKLKNRKTRDETGLFLIEGYRELKRAIDAGVEMVKIFSCPDLFLGENEEALIQSSKADMVFCNEPVFRKMSYRDRPDGLLAIAKQMRFTLSDFEKKMGKLPLLVVAEAFEKPTGVPRNFFSIASSSM
jgi:TrmH family RNA methyltransferase